MSWRSWSTTLFKPVSVQLFTEAVRDGYNIVVVTQPSWCVPCQRLKPHLEQLDDGRLDNVNMVVVDLDLMPTDEGTQFMTDYAIQSVPQAWLYRDGIKVADLVGRTVIKLESEINSFKE